MGWFCDDYDAVFGTQPPGNSEVARGAGTQKTCVTRVTIPLP